MRFSIIFFILIFLSFAGVAQYEGITYQAVIVSSSGGDLPGVDIDDFPLANGTVYLRFTISAPNSAIEYQEVQETQTDEFGMVNVVIGNGIALSELNFDQLKWLGEGKSLLVELSFDGDSFESLNEQDLYFVPYGYHREVIADGTLLVNQESTLNGSLSVQNGEPTSLSGTLNVSGEGTFDGQLNANDLKVFNNSELDGTVEIGQTLLVEGNSQLQSDLSVGGTATITGTTNMNGNANVDEDLAVSGATNLNGRVVVNANISGLDTDETAYPLSVKGSNQGIHIKVDNNRNSSKNFVTFADGAGIHGRIEGETLSELHGSTVFGWDIAMNAFSEGFILAEGLACGAQLDGWEAAVMGANYIAGGVFWVQRVAYNENNVGVLFSSGGADYAEWLEKENPADEFLPGEVVGVKAGKISRSTKNADHIFAISTNPIVLGNMPKEGQEHNYERVGFLGQVPVRVVGSVKLGDYILASGNDDGYAIAVDQANLPTASFDRIIGVAWEESKREGVNTINTAVGMAHNALADKVSDLEREVEVMKDELNEVKRMLMGEAATNVTQNQKETDRLIESNKESDQDQSASAALAGLANNRNSSVKLSNAQFEEWLEAYGFVFEQQMDHLKKYMKEEGITYDQSKDLTMLIDDPIGALKMMHKGEFLPTFWQANASKIKN